MVDLSKFITESNLIEGIDRAPLDAEVTILRWFITIDLPLEVYHMESLVSIFEPGARLRAHPGMNVFVGEYEAPRGGWDIGSSLGAILKRVGTGTPFNIHRDYEALHPFQDGNGRSGRALWLWMTVRQKGMEAPLSFLEEWYYQSLEATNIGEGEGFPERGLHSSDDD